MNIEMLLLIGTLALLDMFSPSIIGVSVYILLVAKKKQTRLLSTYLMTVGLFYFSTGIFLMLGLGVIFSPISNLLDSYSARLIMTIVGGVLFIGSWLVPKRTANGSPKPKSLHVSSMVALGFTTSILEVATALPYFAAIGILTSNQIVFYEWLPLLAGYNLVMIAPGIILLCLHLLFRRFMNKPLRKIQKLFDQRTSSTLSWIMFFVGLILLINGRMI
ncbi:MULTISPECIES: GAP family protein [Lysinibacillus]|uniref:GAP family protein n=1 Tax=Lysinibacillus TaxID=400634 RepID=UPI00214B2A2C|nr:MULTISPECIES: GAP family protein [Lysinibacillus]UUV24667.1 GAP family protein [Lysinibacillus sp. FN11]UYB47538.1 GAP family protein [Lysinibacillus capsici]